MRPSSLHYRKKLPELRATKSIGPEYAKTAVLPQHLAAQCAKLNDVHTNHEIGWQCVLVNDLAVVFSEHLQIFIRQSTHAPTG